ncbi:MAG: hypothetical protein M1812_000482 [Candelaria pacifica]|nr:MAG: hypothetical protein M1812_000482 [Candelaria pacifica]
MLGPLLHLLTAIALLYGNVALVSASPVFPGISDKSLMPRVEDGFSQYSGKSLDTRTADSIEALGLLEGISKTNFERNVEALGVPQPGDRPFYYRFCRREDGAGCAGDVACSVTVNWLVPVSLVLFGQQQLIRGPHVRPAHLAPALALLVCQTFPKAVDQALDGPDKPTKRSLALGGPAVNIQYNDIVL